MLLRNSKRGERKLNFKTRKGFDLLYETYAPKLFAICYSRIQHREESEEIVHDIFQSVWERRDKISDVEGSIERYLIRAAKLKTIDYFRKQNRQAIFLTDEIEKLFINEYATENEYNLIELKVRVAELVDQLPNTCKTVYKCSREQGMSNKEIASKLLISEKTVESHITKALKHFRRNLAEYAGPIVLLIAGLY
ncbi:MAG: RNA polymerase sigma-70 factor [Bacteroidota bacterium]